MVDYNELVEHWLDKVKESKKKYKYSCAGAERNLDGQIIVSFLFEVIK